MNDSTAGFDTESSAGPSGSTSIVTPIEDGDVYRASHDMKTDGLSVTVAQALAEVSDIPATELVTEFSRYADPDALDRLFRSPGSRVQPRDDGFVVLSIRGYRVTIHGDGEILIAEYEL